MRSSSAASLVDTSAGTAIAVDAAGHAYVTGNTSSVDFPTTPGAFRTEILPRYPYPRLQRRIRREGEPRRRLARVLHVPVWQRNDFPTGIALDPAGNIYVAGTTGSGDFPTVNPLQPVSHTNPFGTTGFVSKLSRRRHAPDLLDVSRRVDQRRDQRPRRRRAGQRLRDGRSPRPWTSRRRPVSCSRSGATSSASSSSAPTRSSPRSTRPGPPSCTRRISTARATTAGPGSRSTRPATHTSSARRPRCFFPVLDAFQPTSKVRGPSDAFVAKLNADGTRLLYSSISAAVGGASTLTGSGRGRGHCHRRRRQCLRRRLHQVV